MFPDAGHSRKFQKIAYVAVIDALARAVYPNRSNRARFTSLLRQFGSWDEATRISTPYLAELLAKAPDPTFEPLRLMVNERLKGWVRSTLITVSEDLDLNAVAQRWPKDKEHRTPLGSVSLERLQHINLIYDYRNLLIHEMREQPDAIDLDSKDHPFYLHVTVDYGRSTRSRWDLYYPGEFLKKLAETALASVDEYLQRNQLDPTIHFSSGEYLLEELCR
jgi:hypothetical protein